MVAGARPRHADRAARRERGAHELPVRLLGEARRRERKQPRAVVQHRAERDGLLAVDAEFWPVLRDRTVEFDFPAFDEAQHRRDHRALAGRKERENRIRHRRARRQVADELAVAIDGELAGVLPAGGEEFFQLARQGVHLEVRGS